MLVPGLQTESLSRMTSGSQVDYSCVYEALCKCAQEMLDKYNQKQVHTEKLEVKIRAVNMLLYELRKMPKDSGAIHETVLFALKSHAEALQGHEHLLSRKGNTYALTEQTKKLMERHDTSASLLRYHDLKNKLLGPDTHLNPELKEAMSTWAENKTLTLQKLVTLDKQPRTEETESLSCVYGKRSFPVQGTLSSRLLKDAECCICKNIMNQPREICPEGHLTCLECSMLLADQITNCPNCRSTLLAEFKQNIPVERLIGNLQECCCNSTLLNSFKCCICKQIMNQPREICSENHLICLECSGMLAEHRITNCPECSNTLLAEFKQNIPLERLIGTLQVRCCNVDCGSIIEISEIKSHLDLCDEEEIECPHKCTDEGTGEVLRMPRKRLADHGKECSKRFKSDNCADIMMLFRAFSPMDNGTGLPEKEVLEELLGWLRGVEALGVSLFRLATRLHHPEGIPDIKKLKQYEQKLLDLFFADSIGLECDDRNKDKHLFMIRPVALFLSTGKPQYVLNLRDVEHFYQQESGEPDRKLEKLLALLIAYGGQGVIRYLTLNNDHRKELLLLGSLRIPLPLTMQAITDFSPQERRLYLFFTRNLKNPPDKDQWNNLSPKLNRLESVLKTLNNQRRYLEVIWCLAPPDRDTFLDVTHTAHVITVFPSLSALEKLTKSHSPQRLKALLASCLQLRQGNPSRKDIKRLFAALLKTQLPLHYHDDIPDRFLSEYIETEDDAIFVPMIPPIKTAKKLALYFVDAVTTALSDMLYRYEANKLKIERYGGETHFFPVPELEIQDKGIKISNWPVEVFQRFLAVTEFPEQYYLPQEEWLQYYRSDSAFHFRRRGAAEALQNEALPQSSLSILANLLPSSEKETLSEKEQFQRLWAVLCRKPLLNSGDIQLLSGYKEYITIEQTVKILNRVHPAIKSCKIDQFKQLLCEKADRYSERDPFFLTLSDEAISHLMEAEI